MIIGTTSPQALLLHARDIVKSTMRPETHNPGLCKEHIDAGDWDQSPRVRGALAGLERGIALAAAGAADASASQPKSGAPAGESCMSCRFWKIDHERDDEGRRHPEPADVSFGWCRRFPPRVLDHMASMTIPHLGNGKHNYDPEDVATVSNVESATIFPATYGSTDWCGEYAARDTGDA